LFRNKCPRENVYVDETDLKKLREESIYGLIIHAEVK
jgi:hypothetical protein